MPRKKKATVKKVSDAEFLDVLPKKLSPRRITEQRLTAKVRRVGLKPLTARERKFVFEYVSQDGQISMREAALRAGYAENVAKEEARKLTDPARSPHVVAAIQDLRAEYAAQYGTTYDRHMRDLQRIRDAALAAGAYGAAVTAEYRRGQAMGTIYVDRKEIKVGTIDSMSKEEVEAKLRELKLMFTGAAPSIIDIEPEELTDSPEIEANMPFLEQLEEPEGEQEDDEQVSDDGWE